MTDVIHRNHSNAHDVSVCCSYYFHSTYLYLHHRVNLLEGWLNFRGGWDLRIRFSSSVIGQS